MKDALKALLHSRKILLLGFGVVTALVSHYADVPADVWLSIEALVLAVIGSIAAEDAAAKRAGTHPTQTNQSPNDA